MQKHKWATIAGVCVVALIAVGAMFVPSLYHSLFPTTHVEVEEVELIPAHWWKAEMTEQQLGILAALWGEDITAEQLLQQLWPEVLQQIPQEAATALEKHPVGRWPTEKYQDWKGQFICGGAGVHHDEGLITYNYYVGNPDWEWRTLAQTVEVVTERGFAEDRMYRVSLYTGVGLE